MSDQSRPPWQPYFSEPPRRSRAPVVVGIIVVVIVVALALVHPPDGQEQVSESFRSARR